MRGHVRKGRVYKAPFVADGALTLSDWVVDAFPDLLWPALVLADAGNSAARRFVQWQRDVVAELRPDVADLSLARGLDGTLSGLEKLARESENARKVVCHHAHRNGLLSARVQRALASYAHRPAEWLVSMGVAPPTQDVIDLLGEAVYDSMFDDHREALLKCFSIWSGVQAGTFRTSQETIDILHDYPTNVAKLPQADAVVRAMWGAQQQLTSLDQDPDDAGARETWSRVFWGTNSMTSGCMRKRDAPSEEIPERTRADASQNPEPDIRLAPSGPPDDGKHLRQLALDLLASYIEAATQGPRDLRNPARAEVHGGLVSRAGREVIVALGSPELWCAEHGSHVTRVLVEGRVHIEWMSKQDHAIYQTYKDYGAGKAKLYSRILDEIPEAARDHEFSEAVKQLQKLSYNDDIFDSRIVDTRDSFAGVSLRSMAEESGLLDYYRQSYSLASGVAHGEWWSLETHAMERCRNVLHRGHLIPSMSLSAGGNVPLAKAWVDQLYALIWRSLEILQPDEEVWRAAFAWLEPDGSTDDSPGEGALSA